MKKLIEAILLNACSINSVGLNNGKLGLSLCLFEAAKYLNDESVEDAAFDSLQEVLVENPMCVDPLIQNRFDP